MQIVEIIVPVFIVIGIGYLLKKISLLTSERTVGLNKISYYIALPTLIFTSIVKVNIREIFRNNPNIILGMYITTFLMFIISLFLSLWVKLDKELASSFIMSTFRSNMSYIGFPIIFSIYSYEGLTLAITLTTLLIPLLLILAILGITLFNHKEINKKTIKMIIKSIVTNPLIIAAIVAICFSLSKPSFLLIGRKIKIFSPLIYNLFYLTTISLYKGFIFLAEMAFPLALLALGASLIFLQTQIKKNLNIIIITVVLKLIALPVLCLIILSKLKITGMSLIIPTILMAMPTSVSTYILAVELNSDANLTNSTIMVTTIISIISLPVLLFLLV